MGKEEMQAFSRCSSCQSGQPSLNPRHTQNLTSIKLPKVLQHSFSSSILAQFGWTSYYPGWTGTWSSHLHLPSATSTYPATIVFPLTPLKINILIDHLSLQQKIKRWSTMLSIYKYKIYNPFEYNFVGNSNLKILRPTLQFDKSGYPMKRGSSFFSVYYLDTYIFLYR